MQFLSTAAMRPGNGTLRLFVNRSPTLEEAENLLIFLRSDEIVMPLGCIFRLVIYLTTKIFMQPLP